MDAIMTAYLAKLLDHLEGLSETPAPWYDVRPPRAGREMRCG
jgi:hypothetical protein